MALINRFINHQINQILKSVMLKELKKKTKVTQNLFYLLKQLFQSLNASGNSFTHNT